MLDSLEDVVTKSHDIKEVARASGYLGKMMTGMGHYKEAEAYIKRAYQLNNRKGYDAGLQDNFTQLAELYLAQKRFSEARWYYLQAQRVATNLGNSKDVVEALIGLAGVHTSSGDAFSARRDLITARKIASEKGLLAQLITIENLLYKNRQRPVTVNKTTLSGKPVLATLSSRA